MNMTQGKEDINKIAELNALFLSLDEKGKDSAINILRALEFAQAVMLEKNKNEEPTNHRPA